jgi:hypothetical protein
MRKKAGTSAELVTHTGRRGAGEHVVTVDTPERAPLLTSRVTGSRYIGIEYYKEN